MPHWRIVNVKIKKIISVQNRELAPLRSDEWKKFNALMSTTWENEPSSLDLPLWTDEMSQIMANVYPAVDPALPWLFQHPYFFGLCSKNKNETL